jgi:hypothetical protein
MTSYIQCFLTVARHENESVDIYAKVCGCSSGAMSKRLSELGEVSSRDTQSRFEGSFAGVGVPAPPSYGRSAKEPEYIPLMPTRAKKTYKNSYL